MRSIEGKVVPYYNNRASILLYLTIETKRMRYRIAKAFNFVRFSLRDFMR